MTSNRNDSKIETGVDQVQDRELVPVGRDDGASQTKDDSSGGASNRRVGKFTVLAFVLGSLSWLLGPFSSVPAILCGHAAGAAGRKTPGANNARVYLAGLILGYSFLASAIFIVALAVARWEVRGNDGFPSLLHLWIDYCVLGFVFAAAAACAYFATSRPRFAICAVVFLLLGISIVSLVAMSILQSRSETRTNEQRDHLRRIGGALHQQQDIGPSHKGKNR